MFVFHLLSPIPQFMAPFLFQESQYFSEYVENHEMWIQRISLATLLSSTFIHIINGINKREDNLGAEYETKCVVINLVRDNKLVTF